MALVDLEVTFEALVDRFLLVEPGLILITSSFGLDLPVLRLVFTVDLVGFGFGLLLATEVVCCGTN